MSSTSTLLSRAATQQDEPCSQAHLVSPENFEDIHQDATPGCCVRPRIGPIEAEMRARYLAAHLRLNPQPKKVNIKVDDDLPVIIPVRRVLPDLSASPELPIGVVAAWINAAYDRRFYSDDLPRVIHLSDIKKAVAREFGVTHLELVGHIRKKPIAQARQVGMWLGRKLTALSLPGIGKGFGNKDHTTVLHAIRRIDGCNPEKEPELYAKSRALLDKFHPEPW